MRCSVERLRVPTVSGDCQSMTGEPLLLLPGMMCDERLWEPQVRALGRSRTILQGGITQDDTIEAIASRVLREAPDRFALAGLSMGGIVAMHIVGTAPERVTRLALLDTNHLPDAPERRPIRERQIAAARAGRLREVVVDEMKPQYLADGHKRDRELLDRLVDMAVDLGPDVFVRQSVALMNRPNAEARIRAWATAKRPTLVLCGEEDRLCSPERHREIARLVEHANLTVLSGTGHISTLESPIRVSIALGQWLDALPADD